MGFRTREDANAEQHAEQQAGEIRGAAIRRNRPVRLGALDRSAEEGLDFTQTVGDQRSKSPFQNLIKGYKAFAA